MHWIVHIATACKLSVLLTYWLFIICLKINFSLLVAKYLESISLNDPFIIYKYLILPSVGAWALEMDFSAITSCESKECQQVWGVTMQHDKIKVVFKREDFSFFLVLGNIRSPSLMTYCGCHTAGDALQIVGREKNPFTKK